MKTTALAASAASALLLALGTLTTPAAAAPVPAPAPAPAAAAATKITHADATNRFRSAGITWRSSGNCSDRNNASCTSFDQLNLDTARGAVTLRQASGCAVTVTGGTETGHAGGTYSHWNGYKLDFALASCLDGYVTRTFPRIADRGDGAAQYKSGSGNIYAKEGNHWDVTYYNCGGC
ncbi:hypothetical protein ACN20G_31485 (plasmid) [Streptomyces sp. BI20]|uniref:hypothetical protein n=1 Tax=Streptomyces sp. BI20 TaxID=3403460 RepID=UPI003C76EB08